MKQNNYFCLIFLFVFIIIQSHFQSIICQPAPAAVTTAGATGVKPSKPKSGNSTKPAKPPIDLNSITVDSFMCSKKKIILELGKGGLGNKLWGVFAG